MDFTPGHTNFCSRPWGRYEGLALQRWYFSRFAAGPLLRPGLALWFARMYEILRGTPLVKQEFVSFPRIETEVTGLGPCQKKKQRLWKKMKKKNCALGNFRLWVM